MDRIRIDRDETEPHGDLRELVPLGRPPIVLGENVAEYMSLFARYVADYKPRGENERDRIEDIVDKRWSIKRYRHLKTDFINMKCVDILRAELLKRIEQPSIADEKDLAQIKKYEAELKGWEPQLAERNVIPRPYTWTQEALAKAKAALEEKRQAARAAQVDELVDGWIKLDPETVKGVKATLGKHGRTIDSIVSAVMVEHIGTIKMYDQLIKQAEDDHNDIHAEFIRCRQARPVLEGVKYHEVTPKKGKQAD
jgi:hypothetical protein